MSLCQSIFQKSTSPTDLGKMECTCLLCSIVRIVVGKTEKKHRTDSCLQQENSDSRTMWDDCMKWNFDHQRLYKMDLLKLNLRNQFCVPCFLHFECQRNTSSTIVAYVKITLLRVIPTMTCWVEVVRWGLSLRIWWEEWRIWEHWFQVSLA